MEDITFNFTEIQDIFELKLGEIKKFGFSKLTLCETTIMITHNDTTSILLRDNESISLDLLKYYFRRQQTYISGKHPAVDIITTELPMPIADEIIDELHPYSWLPNNFGDFDIDVQPRHVILKNKECHMTLCSNYCIINDAQCEDSKVRILRSNTTYDFDEVLASIFETITLSKY